MAGLATKLFNVNGWFRGNDAVEEFDEAVNKHKNMRDAMKADRETAVAMASVYTKTIKGRDEYNKSFEEIERFYLTDAITSSIVDDALTPDITTGDVVDIDTSNDAYKKILKDLSNRINFDAIVNEIAPDLVNRGEYTMRVVPDGTSGVKDVVDDVRQEEIVAFYRKGLPDTFLIKGARDIEIKQAWEYVHFCMGYSKIRLEVKKELWGQNTKNNPDDDCPSYARIGKPYYLGVVPKIKELQLLEALVPASKLAELSRSNVVSVSVSNNTSPKEAFDISRKYENILNANKGVNEGTQQISVADILSVAGKTKVIPVFGERGRLESASENYKNRSVDDLLNSIRDNREVICTSIGFPPELLFGPSEGKTETLKRYSRYLRKLKTLQHCLAQGIKQICLIELTNKGHKNININDIEVNFKNELVSLDELEKLEFADALAGTTQTLITFLNDLREDEAYADIVNEEGIHAFLYKLFKVMYADEDLIKDPGDGKNLDKDPTYDDDDVPDPSQTGDDGKLKKKGQNKEEPASGDDDDDEENPHDQSN